jgi:[ribosomal protein S18]-alanine N-acetyltransferase
MSDFRAPFEAFKRWLIHLQRTLVRFAKRFLNPSSYTLLKAVQPVVHVRALDAEDAGPLAVLHALSFAHGWDVYAFQSLLTEKSTYAHGLFKGRDTTPIGFILSRQVLDEAEILTIALHPQWRGRKLSPLLLEPHLAALRQEGVEKLFLEVDEANHVALRLYTRHGFEIIGRREAYYATPTGQRAAAITMRLNVKGSVYDPQ